MEKKYDGMDLWIALVLGTVIACLSWAAGVSIWANSRLGTVAFNEQYAQEKKGQQYTWLTKAGIVEGCRIPSAYPAWTGNPNGRIGAKYELAHLRKVNSGAHQGWCQAGC